MAVGYACKVHLVVTTVGYAWFLHKFKMRLRKVADKNLNPDSGEKAIVCMIRYVIQVIRCVIQGVRTVLQGTRWKQFCG